MRSARHPAVTDHVDPIAHSIDDFGKLIKGCAAAVELATAVVRNHDCRRTYIDRPPRVGDGHHAFETKLSAPVDADCLGNLPVHRLIEGSREVGPNRNRFARALSDMILQIRQFELCPKQIVERPARLHRDTCKAGRCQAQRRRKSGAQIAFAPPANDGIDGQRQRIELGGLAPGDQRGVQPLVLVNIKLEHLGALERRADLLDADRAERGNPEPGVVRLRDSANRRLTMPVEHALKRRRRQK